MKSTEVLLEEVFALTYCMKGMTYGDVERMLSSDRIWYLNRLHEQLKSEADEVKKTTKKPARSKRPRRRRR